MQSTTGSVSELEMDCNLSGKGVVRAKVLKHLSPITMTKLKRALPFGGRLNFFEKDFVYIITPIIQGDEKGRFEFERGDVAFLPGGSFLCFFLRKSKSKKSMNPLGRVDEDAIPLLESARRGDSLTVNRIG